MVVIMSGFQRALEVLPPIATCAVTFAVVLFAATNTIGPEIAVILASIAALFVIMFIYGWNQYLWPLLITTDPDYYTIVMGIQRMTSEENPQWHLIMAAVVMAALPPVLVILFMQRLFVKGLTETEK